MPPPPKLTPPTTACDMTLLPPSMFQVPLTFQAVLEARTIMAAVLPTAFDVINVPPLKLKNELVTFK